MSSSPAAASLIQELDRESGPTRRILSRVPLDHLDWTPHPKSTTLGNLAWHIASIPGRIATIVEQKTLDTSKAAPAIRAGDDFTAELDRNLDIARRILGSFDDAALADLFTLTNAGVTVVSMPAAIALRSILLNHFYHHRGQLTVYLRLLDVPLPVIYGNTADEGF